MRNSFQYFPWLTQEGRELLNVGGSDTAPGGVDAQLADCDMSIRDLNATYVGHDIRGVDMCNKG
jgi:hypothetical protein